MIERRLRVCTRDLVQGHDGDSKWSLFARLSQKTVQDLFIDAASRPPEPFDPSQGWSIHSSSCWNIEFLPLSVTFSNGEEVYISYNGRSIEDDGTIELPSLPNVPSDGQFAVVRVLRSLKDAVSIEIEPLTTEDWEQLEIHSEFLENGGLLSQVSVVYANQTLILAVGDKDTVQVRVTASSFLNDCECCRLVATTEVIVIPKPRQKLRERSPSRPLRVVPSWDDWSPRMQALATRENIIHGPAVPLHTLVAHPETLDSVVPGWELAAADGNPPHAIIRKSIEIDDPQPIQAVVHIMASDKIPKDHVALGEMTRCELRIAPYDHMVSIQLMTRRKETDLLCETKKLIQSGEAVLLLEPVEVEQNPIKDGLALWRSPTCSLASYWSTGTTLKGGTSSFIELEKSCHRLVGNGSIISLASSESNSKTHRLFRVSIQTKILGTFGNDLIIRLQDIPTLLHEPKRAIEGVLSRNQASMVINPTNYNSLNCLPAIPDVSTDALRNLLIRAHSILCSCDGIIIYGEKGTGKTHVALVLAALSRLRSTRQTVYLDCARLQSAGEMRMSDTLHELNVVFEAASASRPTLLVFDNLDCLLPNLVMNENGEGSTNNLQVNPILIDQTKLIADHFCRLTQDRCQGVKILITCCELKSIAIGALPVDSVFRPFSIPTLGNVEAVTMLSLAIGECVDEHSIRFSSEINKRIEGFRPSDIERIAAITCHELHSKMLLSGTLKPMKFDEDTLHSSLDVALEGFIPLSRQGIRNEAISVVCEWNDVGGLFKAKKQLTTTILHPVKYRRIYQQAPTQLPRGLLLFGPPGCGKSLIAPALAKECGLTLITCYGPELLDKYIGASEHKVRQLFARAQAAAPALLFLDEFEALAPRRGSDHTGVTDRVVNQLLTFLDGVESTLDHVYIVAATSRPDKIDPALLRPGRLEKHVYIGLPETKYEWTDVVRTLVKSRELDDNAKRFVESEELYEVVAESSAKDFSPADLKAALDTAQLSAVHEYLEMGSNSHLQIKVEHVLNALMSTRPSLSVDDRSKLESLYAPFRGLSSNAGPKDQATTLR